MSAFDDDLTMSGQGPVAEPARTQGPVGAPETQYRSCVARPTPGRLLSGYGERSSRAHPDVTVMHGGADYAGPAGAPVYAMADGVVEHATGNGAAGFARYGRVVVIKHPQFRTAGETIRTMYAHLGSRPVDLGSAQPIFRLRVNPGDYVRAGQQIGTVGDTDGSVAHPGSTFAQTAEREGRALTHSNAHLHFEVAAGRYPRPPVSRAHENPRAERKDPELWLAGHPQCRGEERREREPVQDVSSREHARQRGFPLWVLFGLGALFVGLAKGKG